MVQNPIPGVTGTGLIGNAINVNGVLFYRTQTGANGFELWKSNGTEVGTLMVKDIYPGTASSYHSSTTILTNINGVLYFTANDGINGEELWKSDGTAAGTVMVQDIAIPGGSNPFGIIQAGSHLFVGATTDDYGQELWVSDYTILPLSLLEFNGQLKNNNGELFWKTSNEINSHSFEVERSTNGRNFKSVGTINAANTSGTHRYAFTDSAINKLGVPVVYYRLKQKDIDGHFTHSSILLLQLAKSSSNLLLYPNPVRQTLQMTISTSMSERIQVNIYDQSGRKLQHQQQPLLAGSNALSLDVQSLPAGTYYLELKGAGVNEQKMFIKQ
jgi:ELWxxDGT repeat protein